MKLPRASAKTSLRLRLVLGLSLTLCVLWGSVAAWLFSNMQHELRNMLDDRLVASARMVAGIVHQFQPTQADPIASASPAAMLSVIARDGVACDVSLVRSEVEILPIAKTSNSPDFSPITAAGFGRMEKGGKVWRTYVLMEDGIRIVTADRLDVRDQLITSFVYTLVLPFLLALAGILVLTWWICTLGLDPLRRLQEELRRRPPQDPTPIQSGQDTMELSPLVDSLNHLLTRMDAAIEHERRWTSDAAHELRTPLTAIKTHVQVAQLVLARESTPDVPPAQAIHALRHANEGIDHMHATLEQLLQLARVESAECGATPVASGTDMAEALHLACRQSLQRASKAGKTAPQLDVQVRATTEALAAYTLPLAPALLACAITNLTDNALLHHQGSAPVQVTLELLPTEASSAGDGAEAATTMHIRVRDHGPGLSAPECEKALQRFWRKTSTTQGSGLGLTIVQRIAESAGGTLRLRPGTPGLVAEIQLPLQSAKVAPATDRLHDDAIAA